MCCCCVITFYLFTLFVQNIYYSAKRHYRTINACHIMLRRKRQKGLKALKGLNRFNLVRALGPCLHFLTNAGGENAKQTLYLPLGMFAGVPVRKSKNP